MIEASTPLRLADSETRRQIIRVVDLETTGFDPADDRVIEIGWCDLEPDGNAIIGMPAQWRVHAPRAVLVDPGRPIPPASSAIHHLIDEDVAGCIGFADAALAVVGDKSGGPDRVFALAAHSAKFERGWLTDEVTSGRSWICTYKCALRLFPDAPSHSNQALRYHLRPPGLDRSVAHAAHRAGPDAYVTAHLLALLLERADIAQLAAWSSQPALQVTCHIGKNRGLKWRDVDYSFLEWVSYRDFDEDVLFTVRHEMDRRDAEARAATIDDEPSCGSENDHRNAQPQGDAA